MAGVYYCSECGTPQPGEGPGGEGHRGAAGGDQGAG